jgi:hypothetical protein
MRSRLSKAHLVVIATFLAAATVGIAIAAWSVTRVPQLMGTRLG